MRIRARAAIILEGRELVTIGTFALMCMVVCLTMRMALASSLRFERAKKGPSMSKAQAMQLEKIRVSPENVLVT